MTSPCPECGAARGHLLGCSRSDAAFALAPPEDRPPVPADGKAFGDEELSFELKARAIAVPAMLLFCWVLSGWSFGAFIERTFAGMWLHELGHASTSWLCGYRAIPLPWFTAWSPTRSFGVSALLFLALLGGLAWAIKQRRFGIAVGCGVTLLLAVCGHLMSHAAAEQLRIFAGDAGAMVYGALMVATFFAPRSSRLVKGALRWGLLGWGASAMADALRTWVEARRDFAALPFGLEDGNLSDASKLVETYRWAELTLINRYLAVGALSYIAVIALWVWGVRSQRAKLD